MPTITMNTTGMMFYRKETGWSNPRSGSDMSFGYNNSEGCRAIAYQFTCPHFLGTGKSINITIPIYFPSGDMIVQHCNISVTGNSPEETGAYNERVLGNDTGRIGTVSQRINKSDSIKNVYEFDIPVTGLVPGSNYYIVISASEGLSSVVPVGIAKLSMFYFPRPSTISIPPKARNYLGGEINILINRYSSEVSHRITYSFVNSSGVVIDNYSKPDSVTWTPPMSLAYEVLKAMSGMCELVCETIVDGEVIGSSSITFRLHFPSEKFKPTISSITASPVSDNGIVSGWKAYVQGYSRVKVTVSTSAIYGASVVDCVVTIGSAEPLNGFSVTSDVVHDRGAIPVNVVVTDSRGQQSTATTQVYYYPYARPALNNIICHRSNDVGSYHKDGTHYFAQATSKYSSVAGRNSCVIEARIKQIGDEYGDAELLTSGVGAVCGSELSPYNTYVVQIIARDALNATPYTITIPEERDIFKIKNGGRGIGIGTVPTEDDLLDVGLDAKFQAGVRISGEYPTLTFTVGNTVVGEIGSYSDGPTIGSMFMRVYDSVGNYKEYTWSAS